MRVAVVVAAVLLLGGLQASRAEAEEWPTSTFKSKAAASEHGLSAVIDTPTPRLANAVSTIPEPSERAEVGQGAMELPRQPRARAEPGDLLKPADHRPDSWRWRILRNEWTAADERGFEAFVRRIGESDCKTMHECLTSAASNPTFHANNPVGMQFFADCADLPYLLRAYYAWQNGLPFSLTSGVRSLGAPGDLRYNTSGNQVAARKDYVSAGMDARRAIPEITGLVTTAQFRTGPEAKHKLLPDHYPVGITRDSIKPGTIIYDAYGHVAVVYDVTPEGRVLFMDSHPDNALTRGVYGRAFHRQAPAVGGGFKRWRPVKLVDAKRGPDGSYTGGRIVLAPDRELTDWSDEQYYGTDKPKAKDWSTAHFVVNGKETEYYRFVRLRLAPPGFRYDPVDEVRAMVRILCREIGDRRDAVDIAVKAKIQQRAQPTRLPYNIYGTDGDWEIYSTPSRDARLKTNFQELRDEIARFLDLAAQSSDEIRYSGQDLRRDLREAYDAETAACSVTYTRSNGVTKTLSFPEIVARLFHLSFDPYHCPERRWGATMPEELASCPDDQVKRAWYDAEQRLRNQIDRHYDARMDLTLAQLRQKLPGSGVDAPPDIDVPALLGGGRISSTSVTPARSGSQTP